MVILVFLPLGVETGRVPEGGAALRLIHCLGVLNLELLIGLDETVAADT